MYCVPLCQHIKSDGIRCASPAMRGHNLCYFHSRTVRPARRRLRRNALIDLRRSTGIDLPALDTPDAIVAAIEEIMHAVVEKRVELGRARALLYGLQTIVLAQGGCDPGALAPPFDLFSD